MARINPRLQDRIDALVARPEDVDTCPRCGTRHRMRLALSRTDNATYICSNCGTIEAMEDFTEGAPTPQAEWKPRR